MDGKYSELNKHIVWLTPGFTADESDDKCTPYLTELMHFINGQTHLNLTVVSLHYPYTRKPYFMDNTQVFPLNGRNKWFLKPMVWRRCLQTLEKIHSKKSIDCIHSFWFGDTTLMAEAFSKKHKIPHIANLMGQDALPSNRHLANRRLAKIPVIAPCHAQALQFKASAHRDVAAINPFGIDYVPKRKMNAEIDVVGVGSIVAVKNYELWVKVIHYLQKKIPDVKASIVGGGPELNKIKSLIKQFNLQKNIHLMGGQSRSKTLETMAASKTFLHTSKFEGQGYVFVEAMKLGLPIVTTPVGIAASEVLIWKGTDPIEMANKLFDILNDKLSPVDYTVPSVRDTFNGLRKFYYGEK